MGSDVGSSFREPCGAKGLGVCAVFCAGVELDLLSGRSVCSAADISCRDGGGGCTATAEDGVEGLGNGIGCVERVCGCGAVHLQDVWDHIAGVRDCGRDHPIIDRPGYACGQEVAD